MQKKNPKNKNIEIKCLLFLKSSNREKSTYVGINMQNFTPAKTPNLYGIQCALNHTLCNYYVPV